MPSLEQLQRDVGRRIAECRVGAGLTQLELAEALDMSLQYVQRVEAGHVNMTLGSLRRWSHALGVSPNALLERPTTARRGRGRPPVAAALGLPFRRVKRSPRALPAYAFKVAAGAWIGGTLKSRNPTFPDLPPAGDQVERPFGRLVRVVG